MHIFCYCWVERASHCSEQLMQRMLIFRGNGQLPPLSIIAQRRKLFRILESHSSHTLPVQFVPAQSSTCEILFGLLCHSRSCRCRSERTPSSHLRHPGTLCRLERHDKKVSLCDLKILNSRHLNVAGFSPLLQMTKVISDQINND